MKSSTGFHFDKSPVLWKMRLKFSAVGLTSNTEVGENSKK